MAAWIVGFILEFLIYFGALYLGWHLCGRGKKHAGGSAVDPLICLFFGWYFQSLLIYGLGLAGLLAPYPLSLAIFIPLGLMVLDRAAFFPWLRSASAEFRTLFRGAGGLGWLVGLAAIWLAAPLAVPPFFYDTLFYHYGQPQFWLLQGRIRLPGPTLVGWIPMPTRMHNLWGLGLLGDPMAGLIGYFNILLAALTVGRIFQKALHWPPPWPILGVFAVLGTPMVWELLLYRMVDPTVVWAGAVLLHLALSPDRRGNPDGSLHFMIFAMTAGMVLMSKPGVTLGYVLGCCGLYRWRAHVPWKRYARRWLYPGLFALVIPAMPWVFHAWFLGGSPFAALRPDLGTFPIATTRWRFALGHGFHFHDLAGQFIRFLAQCVSPDPRLYASHLGWFLLLGVPAGLFTLRSAWLRLTWAAGFLGVFLTFQFPRFTAVLTALEWVLALSFCRRHLRLRKTVVLLLFVTVFQAYHLATARETGLPLRSAWQRFFLKDAPQVAPSSVLICRWANAHLEPSSTRILFIGESRYYPCRIPFNLWDPYFRHPLERLHHGRSPEAQWDHVIQSGRYTHLLYTPEETRRFFEWPESLITRMERWMLQRGRVVAAARDNQKHTLLIALDPAKFPPPKDP